MEYALRSRNPAERRSDCRAVRRIPYPRPLLNQPFAGKVLALAEAGGGLHKITIHFDEPVDVVTFESFSAFRQRINAQIDGSGVSPRKTSNGLPHLVLDI